MITSYNIYIFRHADYYILMVDITIQNQTAKLMPFTISTYKIWVGIAQSV
jgi:hypothetical protein